MFMHAWIWCLGINFILHLYHRSGGKPNEEGKTYFFAVVDTGLDWQLLSTILLPLNC